MFEQRELRTTSSADVWGTVGPIQEVLFRVAGIQTTQAGPATWVGKGPETGYGYVMKATLVVVPSPYGSTVDLRLEAELEDKGIMLLYVSWLVCFPAAALVFILAYQQCRSSQAAIYREAWSTSSHLLTAGPT